MIDRQTVSWKNQQNQIEWYERRKVTFGFVIRHNNRTWSRLANKTHNSFLIILVQLIHASERANNKKKSHRNIVDACFSSTCLNRRIIRRFGKVFVLTTGVSGERENVECQLHGISNVRQIKRREKKNNNRSRYANMCYEAIVIGTHWWRCSCRSTYFSISYCVIILYIYTYMLSIYYLYAYE